MNDFIISFKNIYTYYMGPAAQVLILVMLGTCGIRYIKVSKCQTK